MSPNSPKQIFFTNLRECGKGVKGKRCIANDFTGQFSNSEKS